LGKVLRTLPMFEALHAMRKVTVVSLVFIIAGCVSTTEARYTILPKAQSEISGSEARKFVRELKSIWQAKYGAFESFPANFPKIEWTDYRIQFNRGGSKIIKGSAFCEETFGWETVPYQILDGCFCKFTAQYNKESREVTNFEFGYCS
jgi:hypothetical protein